MFSKAESNNEFKAESENNLKIKKKRVNPLFMYVIIHMKKNRQI